MLDDETGSVWSHLDGRAIGGELSDAQLRVLPLQTTTWGVWLDEHPQSTTLDLLETDLAWVAGYEDATGRPFVDRLSLGSGDLAQSFRDSLGEIDTRLPANELVIGVVAGAESRAFPVEPAQSRGPIEDTVGGVPIVILETSAGSPSLAYHRKLTDGRVLSFERRDRGIYDIETGSRWDSTGLAIEGSLRSVQLSFVTSFLSEWYGWAAFHPSTTIYEDRP